ncbi:hypothetical protein FB45DRAFT_867851 [Roridomyces roridus]|uniref:Uncharacterized protein n=1 Tax=Roridomyces roridus TaxID=1738132 RepID=A0AAD7BRT3_9AGAR|nr:hypothetical protein FB45DRAFT_867851 [Roridomyces roridus]
MIDDLRYFIARILLQIVHILRLILPSLRHWFNQKKGPGFVELRTWKVPEFPARHMFSFPRGERAKLLKRNAAAGHRLGNGDGHSRLGYLGVYPGVWDGRSFDTIETAEKPGPSSVVGVAKVSKYGFGVGRSCSRCHVACCGRDVHDAACVESKLPGSSRVRHPWQEIDNIEKEAVLLNWLPIRVQRDVNQAGGGCAFRSGHQELRCQNFYEDVDLLEC